ENPWWWRKKVNRRWWWWSEFAIYIPAMVVVRFRVLEMEKVGSREAQWQRWSCDLGILIGNGGGAI
ncbi:hypothetical protein A2U01_0116743, partial [Trifolium medium]|nr:hypothetical protein [Trifolium medium]